MLVATLLALTAACLHATWNLIIKLSGDRFVAAWAQFLAGSALFLPVLLVVGPPSLGTVGLHLAASGAIHVVYVLTLIEAYRHGDFGLSYPMARGIGAVGAAVGGVVLLGDHLPVGAWFGVAVVGAGLVWLVVPVERTAMTWAGLTGCAIASYTTVDSAGARLDDGVAYGIGVSIASAIGLTVVGLVRGRGPDLVGSLRSQWPRYLAAGFCLTLAYTLVLVAVSQDGVPVGYVSVLRESSVVIGAAVAWLVLHEDLGRKRLLASGVITAGLVTLVLLRATG